MSKHDGQIGEIIDTNMFGQFKVEFEDGFVHPYEPNELRAIEPKEVPAKPAESTDQQQNTESKTQHLEIGDVLPEGNWKLKDIGNTGITIEQV